MRLSDLRVEAHNGLLAGDVVVSPALDVQGRYRAELPPCSRCRRSSPTWGPRLRPRRSSGTLRAEGEAAARRRFRSRRCGCQGEGDRDRGDGSARDRRARGQRPLRAGPAGDRRRWCVSSSGGGQARFEGFAPVTATGGAYDLNGVVESLDLAPLLAIAGVDGRGPLNGRVRIDGPQRAAGGARQRERGSRCTAARSPSSSRSPVRQRHAGVDVDRFDATLAGGRVHGTGAYDSRTRARSRAARRPRGCTSRSCRCCRRRRRASTGCLGASLTLSGTIEAPAGELRTSIEQPTVEGSPIPGLLLTGRSDGRQLALSGGTLGDARTAFLRGSGSLEGDGLLRIEIDAAALPLQEYLDALPATRQQGATAKARGRLTIDVPLRDPKALRYSGEGLMASGQLRDSRGARRSSAWTATRRRRMSAACGCRRTSRLPGSRQRTEAERAGAAGDTPPPPRTPAADRPAAGGTLSVDGRVAIAADRRFDLLLKGGLDLGVLRALLPEQWIAGLARVDLHLAGTAADPDLRGELSVDDARGRYGTLRVTGANAVVRLEGDRAVVQQLEARLLDGRITATGSLPVRRLGGREVARLHFEVGDLDLADAGERLRRRRARPRRARLLRVAHGRRRGERPLTEGIRARGCASRGSRSSRPRAGSRSPRRPKWTLENSRYVQSPLRLVGPVGGLEAPRRGAARGRSAVGVGRDRRAVRPADALALRAGHDARGTGTDRPARELGREGRADGRRDQRRAGRRRRWSSSPSPPARSRAS